ncbi:MAG: T9SS type A sorting domain-containing protein, partial [Dysgonamonadaceae bacterium]|nr:T9SS type A sorting domain-containing protein [Dysgonamonadaceae bacterium]
NIYFNPVEGNIVLESETDIETVKVFNIQGVLLYEITPRSTLASQSLTASPAGVYIVQASGKEIKSTKKIIKQ